ncbi:Hypoxanthine phosphoribosyltransferase [Porphyridium purpureum]|uniref:Hypoxanthine phosphoribosyltransferase n=1 Tax=Porphyridium purpureum TaxID=35688 RepID=A0A5J4Z262_PORPP|nr:Hypoxanthine phosphoribosyltransferase [Porphyridium purpureum]|eukprot:POR3082..scf208_2
MADGLVESVPDEFQDQVARVLLSEERIGARVKELGAQIGEAYRDQPLVILGVLTGSYMFVADLTRAIPLSKLEVYFIKASSYEGTGSSGQVKLSGLDHVDLTGRHVLIVEDIVDTGLTLQKLKQAVRELDCKSVAACTLLHKNTSRRLEGTPPVEFVAFEIADEFVVGYGLDYNQSLRHLPFVGIFRTKSAS